MKLWAGRFSKDTDKTVNDFNSSIAFDARMYKEDIEGSIAHSTMLSECGILTENEKDEIIAALKEILTEIENGTAILSADSEDIHMNIEVMLTEKIGATGKRLHTARSRNDQVALDIRLNLKKEITEIEKLLVNLENALIAKAKENKDTVMSGYTHLQRAQPITFAHALLAYAQMFKRDLGRLSDCYDRMDEMPLGSGALATTTYNINRQRVCELLDFRAVTENSLDSVSDRDFVIELASALSLLMMHLSRFSEEIILWCSFEFSFIELDDAYSTGSSIMPQKKNPDIPELIRGKTGRVYGHLMSLLTVMKALPLAYNKDMQEDKEAIFDSVDTVKLCLEVFAPMLETMTVKKENMKKAAQGGFINATDCADYLVKKGMPFRDAYKIVGRLVALCIEKGKHLESLSIDEYKSICDIFENDVYTAINIENCVNGRKVYGGPAVSAVEKQIDNLEIFLKEFSYEL